MKKVTLMLFVLLVARQGWAFASFDELMADLNRKQVEAIQLYLEKNPEAGDIAEARERLIYGLIEMDDYASALQILEQMYRELPADKTSLDIETTFGEVIVPIIQLYRMDGRSSDAMAFIETVREAFKDHEQAETIHQALEEFATMFDGPAVGDDVTLSFTAIDGREVDVAAMTGQVVLVDFWATWCGPCLKAMPALKALYRDFHEKGFEIIGISLDDDREKLDHYLAKEEITWPQYFDGLGWENEIAATYQVTSIPTTFLVGPDGKIVAVDANETKLRAMISSLLEPPAVPDEARRE